ncbi:ABC exporter membrane fusion protein [Desmonostoc muscorum LEGE 12446]|uniref:ABC exporter membrane fusion protein n=1 Tax=Desmonostoc muscorum LEGE 12446 TaxID=1828758 RepID=A0A8J6ZVU4_DESMC|nr:ABC exporter membrane fusion protein [Desmonostoc muscorum LEGE 12446]
MQKLQKQASILFKLPKWNFVTLIVVVSTIAITIPVYYFLNTKTVKQKPLVTSAEPKAITALGRLEPEGEVINISASSTLEGVRVKQLLIKEGDWVKAGQIIAVLDRRDRLDAQFKQSQKEIEVAQARLDLVKSGSEEGEIAAQKAIIARLQTELFQEGKAQEAKMAGLRTKLLREQDVQQAKLSSLKAELNNAVIECQRYETLFQQGAVPASTRDTKCLASKTSNERFKEAEAAKNQVIETLQEQINETQASRSKSLESLVQQIVEAKASLQRIQQVRPEDVKVAQAEVESAIAAAKKAQQELDLAYVRTFKEGKILKLHTYPGEVVDSNGVVELGQTKQMYAVAEVYETNIGKVRLGQKATISSEYGGFTGELQGAVENVGLKIGKRNILDTDPAANVDVRVMEVKIKINPEDSQKVTNLTNLQVKVSIRI